MTKELNYFQNQPFDCKVLDISYLAIPKNGSSYVKSLFYRLDNFNHRLNIEVPNRKWHEAYRNKKGHKVFLNQNKPLVVFLRDPLDRFISGFNHRIVKLKEILGDIDNNEEKLEIFVDRFEYFLKNIPTINWHFSPQIYYIKKYLRNKHLQIHSVEEINNVLSRFFNKQKHNNELNKFYYSISKQRVNKTDKEFLYLTAENIPSSLKNKINLHYSQDYDLLKKIKK